MPVRKYSSRAQQTTLSSPITSTASTMTVVSGSSVMGGKTLSGAQTYTVVIDPDTALEEIVDITVYTSGNTLTITRGVDGPNPGTGVAHSAGAVVRHMAIGRDYQEANDHIEETTLAHGITLANIVLDTDTDVITTAMLQSNSVTTAKITDANITAAKLASDSVTTAKITDLNVTTGKIADLAVTAGKIADSAITSAKIADGTIVAGDIADGAITSSKILDATIVAGDLADGAITSAKILDGTIVNSDINASAAIDKTKISGIAITAGDTGTVTSTMIADATIVNADISATAAIAKTKLDLGGTITSADIVDGTIVASDIADGTITAAKLVSDPYARANHTGTQTASTVSDFNTAVRTNRLDQMAAPTAAVALNAQKITGLATPTDNTDASTKAYVDAQVNALVDGAPGTLNTLNEIATAISSGGSFESTVVLKSGSTMTGALTLSGAPSSNLHAATKAYVDTVAGSTAAAEAAATAAAASYDSFDDRYLGSKATAPTLDNDGNALIEGALYWNSVDNAMYAWTGTEWGSISSTAEIYRFRFTAAGGETTISGLDDNGLTLSYLPGKEQVYLNGVLLVRTTDYTASSGSSLTSLAALAASDIVEIITFTSFEVADAIARSVFDAKGDILVGTAADTVGKLPVGASGQFLKADSSTTTGLSWGEVAGALAQPTEPSSPSDGQIWIDTDGTVTTAATLTRWYKAPTAGTTTLSGAGDNSVTLAYTAGYEQVYVNGVLQVRGSDYTATDGAIVTLLTATVDGDVVEVIGTAVIGITDVYTQGQSDAKYVPKNLTTTTGDIIYASGANTPARLGIGSSGQVLGVSGGVPAWSTPSSGGMTLISTTNLASVSTVTFSSIPSTYKDLVLIIRNAVTTTIETQMNLRMNTDSNANRHLQFSSAQSIDGTAIGFTQTSMQTGIFTKNSVGPTDYNLGIYTIADYANTVTQKYIQGNLFQTNFNDKNQSRSQQVYGGYNQLSAISSIQIFTDSGNWNSGTVLIYGVK